jgi:CRP-like cAMP-binding protein
MALGSRAQSSRRAQGSNGQGSAAGGRDAVAAFAGTSVFSELSKRQLGALAKSARRIVHKPGDEVAAQGRGGLAFHVIVDGDAAVSVDGKARRTLYPGDSFGEISMIDGQPRSATVTAGERGLTTYALDRTRFLALVEDDRTVARAVMVALCGRIRANESSL